MKPINDSAWRFQVPRRQPARSDLTGANAAAKILFKSTWVILAILLTALTAEARAQEGPAFPAVSPAFNDQAAAERLAGAVRIKTITFDDRPDASAAEFLKLHDYLAQQFPLTHKVLRREIVNKYSLLFTWQGSNPSAEPILLMAHQDVVPIAPGTQKQWGADPFGGDIKDGFVWGRGAWDDKGNLCAIMQAVELLIAGGYRPTRTIYLAFGHDEEAGTRGGSEGAVQIAALLKSRGIRFAFVLDEGLLITHGVLAGLKQPAALIGVAEKGYLTLALTAHATPGHSSMPPARTAIGALSAALVRLEKDPMPAAIRGVTKEMFATLAPKFSGINSLLLANLWLTGPIVRHQLEKLPSANAMLRTTTALTVIRAGNKEQVLPGEARALVNFRLLPGDSRQEVIGHVRAAIADDSIQIEPGGPGWDASPVARTDSPAYALIDRTIREVFPGTLVAPGLMVGATDSRHMIDIARNVYRFSPVRAGPGDLSRFHGTNERISIANYAEMIRFYYRLLSHVATMGPDTP